MVNYYALLEPCNNRIEVSPWLFTPAVGYYRFKLISFQLES